MQEPTAAQLEDKRKRVTFSFQKQFVEIVGVSLNFRTPLSTLLSVLGEFLQHLQILIWSELSFD